jgi:hypothetical protein
MIARDIVVEANCFYEGINFRRFDTLLCNKWGILKYQSGQVTEVIVRVAKDGEVDIVEIDKTQWALVIFWNFDYIKYL